jgi:uncharacterized membrane protein
LLFHSLELPLEVINIGTLLSGNGLIIWSLVRLRLLSVEIYPSHSFLYSSITVVIIGIYLVAVPEGATFRSLRAPFETRGTGIGLILIASLFWTVSIAFLKMGLQKTDPFLANGIRLPVSALALMPLAFFEKAAPTKSRSAPWRLWVLGAFSGVLAFGVGGALFLTAIQQAGAGKAMVLTSCAPLFGLPISLFFLKERVTLRILAGTILMVIGVAFIF